MAGKILRRIEEVRLLLREVRAREKTVGFVPTMGYLHEGHLSLIRRARADCDFVVISIFVNPLQFGAGEDYEEYPRDLSRDAELAFANGCDAIFAPTVREMYPQGFATYVEVERLTEHLCGASRPGHFRGVATVVTKLFNIVCPDHAYFGQKDAQQALIIKRLAADLNFHTKIHVLPTVREPDGLAMSSRNAYLNHEERQAATVLYRSLCAAKEKIDNGERDAARLIADLTALIAREPLADIDYVSIVDLENLQPLEKITGKALIALAVRIGRTRLIDNIIVEV